MRSSLTISETIAISLGVGAIALITAIYFNKNKKKQKISPIENWEYIGDLKEIDLYPIKSSSAVSVEVAACDEFGLSCRGIHDRRLLVINEADKKIASVGRYPRLLAIKVEISAEGVLSLSSKTSSNNEALLVDFKELRTQNRPQHVKKMKGYSLNLTECLPVHHVWISRVVLQKETGMRLYLADSPKIEKSFWRTIKNDFIPVMVMHKKSVDVLNSKIVANSEIHHLQFRGNLLIESLEHVPAFDEDEWLWLKIGDDSETCTILHYDSPCLRCTIPNINIQTCERSADFEPLKTMQTFRLRSHPKEPEMGVYFKIYKTGNVKIGDAVYGQYKKKVQSYEPTQKQS